MVPKFTGRIVEWDAAGGHGWVETDGQRIFLHRRDFAELRKRPAVGDAVEFTAGTGPTGRTCARNAVHLGDGGRMGGFTAFFLLALLTLPTLAAARLPIDPRVLAGYAVAISLIAYGIYARDKRQARRGGWRISEGTLHFLELIGGWPGAFIAQRRLRHKCSKRSYQFVFWLLTLAWQVVAVDALTGWRISATISQALSNWVGLMNLP